MGQSTRIIVIDDEPAIRDLLVYELWSRGYTVTAVSNGQEALEMMIQVKFQLAISDMKMPGMGGLELLKASKALDPEIEFIMITGFGTVEDAVQSIKLGAYDFIQKPFDLRDILALVERALEKRDLKQMLGVYEASRAVFTSTNLDELLPRIVKITLSVLRADDVSVMLVDETNRLRMLASSRNGSTPWGATLEAGERVAGRVLETMEPALITGPLDTDPRFQGTQTYRDIHSSIIYPLILQGEILGVLNINRVGRKEAFNDADLRTAAILGAQIAQAISNARLYGRLETKIVELDRSYRDLAQAQDQLIRSEKLALLGQLSAGITHEIKNPLSGIIGLSEMMLENSLAPSRHGEYLRLIRQEGQRCLQITQQLLQFSSPEKPHAEPLALVPLLEFTLKLMKPELVKAGINIETAWSGPLPQVLADPSEIQQVFMNLIGNARQALEGRSLPRLVLKAGELDGKVLLSFQDNGCGIPQENLAKIFDPFFTTKPRGVGTGLGLSICYGIIHRFGGQLRVESETEVGTTFTIELPVLTDGQSEKKVNSETAVNSTGS